MIFAGSTTTFALCTPISGERKTASSWFASFLTFARLMAPPRRAWSRWPRDISPPADTILAQSGLRLRASFSAEHAAEDGRTVGTGSGAEAGFAGRDRGPRIKVADDPGGSYGAGVCVRSLRDIGHTSWKEVLEPMVLFDRILRQDPAGAYARMDFESRDLYRTEVANIAEHSDLSEGEVAAAALALARAAHQETHASPRLAARLGHIGYYLLAEGATGACTAKWAFSLRWASGSHLSCDGIRTSFICRAQKCSRSPSCRRSCCC